jgi:plasmid stabilization system protein ParE
VAKIRWTVGARRDLHEIINYIAEDSPAYAINFAERIILAVDRLETFPKLGRIVPEYQDTNVRELIVGNYRVVYRIQGNHIGIAAIAHASRDLLRKLPSAPWDLS